MGESNYRPWKLTAALKSQTSAPGSFSQGCFVPIVALWFIYLFLIQHYLEGSMWDNNNNNNNCYFIDPHEEIVFMLPSTL